MAFNSGFASQPLYSESRLTTTRHATPADSFGHSGIRYPASRTSGAFPEVRDRARCGSSPPLIDRRRSTLLLTACASPLDEEKRDGDDHVGRQELQPLEPMRFAIQ